MLYGRVYGTLPANIFRPNVSVPIYAFYGLIPSNMDINCLRVKFPYELLFTVEHGYFDFALQTGQYTFYAYLADKLVLLGRVNVPPYSYTKLI